MKIRTSFVSNSSSSSFIVAINKKGECPHCHRRDPNLLDIIDAYPDDGCYESTELYLRTMDADTLRHHCDGWFGGEVGKDIYKKALKFIEEGKEIGHVSIRYGDALYDSLKNAEKSGDLTVIYCDH